MLLILEGNPTGTESRAPWQRHTSLEWARGGHSQLTHRRPTGRLSVLGHRTRLLYLHGFLAGCTSWGFRYGLFSASILRLYFCRPPRTLSRRTPASRDRQRLTGEVVISETNQIHREYHPWVPGRRDRMRGGPGILGERRKERLETKRGRGYQTGTAFYARLSKSHSPIEERACFHGN